MASFEQHIDTQVQTEQQGGLRESSQALAEIEYQMSAALRHGDDQRADYCADALQRIEDDENEPVMEMLS